MRRVARGDLATDIAAIKAAPARMSLCGAPASPARRPRQNLIDESRLLTMSLDGYVAKQDNTSRLFDWSQNGEVALPTPAGDFTVHLSPASARHWKGWVSSVGAPCIQGDRVTHLVFPVTR